MARDPFRDLKRKLRAAPVRIATDVARRAAPVLTDLVQGAFDAGRTVFGGPRPRGITGEPLTLRDTGTTERELRFVSIGRIVRCRLGPRYARYLIRYGILPNGAMPVQWSRAIKSIVSTTGAP